MRTNSRLIAPFVLACGITAASSAKAQKSSKDVGGQTACALLSQAEIRKATGRNDVANRTTHMDEDTQFSSNCQHWGAIDITVHIGTQTKVMFERERDTYAKAPARLGYKIQPISGLGDNAYFMSYSGKAEVRTIVGEKELAVSLSGSLPPDPEAKQMAINVAKAGLVKLH